MVTDQEISQVLQSLLTESNPRRTFTSLNDIVQELQVKLGLDLSHKLDFITSQISHIFRSHSPRPPQPPPPQLQPPRPLLQPQPQPQFHYQQLPKDQFALPPNPNFQAAPAPVIYAFQSFASHPQVGAAKLDSPVADGKGPEVAAISGTEVPKERAQAKPKRRGGPGGLNKLCGVTPELQVIVGQPALPRTEIVKQLWAYIRKNNLQDPSNKRKIICNDELRVVLETDCTDMFMMNKLIAKHIIPLEPTKQPIVKKQKLDVEPETKASDPVDVKPETKVTEPVDVEPEPKATEPSPSDIISDALANFFGITGREMLHSEVLRRLSDYIKVNQLEDPLNPMIIICDAKLQELFGCESISVLKIPEVLGRHHIFRRSRS